MTDEHSRASGSQQDQSGNATPADKVSEDDPHKVEKLARGEEDTGAVDQEE